MKIYYGTESIPANYAGACATLGVFDGLHSAHRRIIQQVVEIATEKQCHSMLITFEPHPRQVLNPQPENHLPIITTAFEKGELLKATGIDDVLFIKTNPEFLNITESDFVEKILVRKLNVCSVVVGYDYHFGRNRLGNPQSLKEAGQKFGFDVVVVPAFNLHGIPVSSSLIRQLLLDGQIKRANELLSWPYSFYGIAVKGSGRGKQLGFPTANLVVAQSDKLIPADGVYFVKAYLLKSKYYGILNIGVRKTFNESERVIELYLIDFPDKKLYGVEIKVAMLERLRDEIKFETVAALEEAMQADLKLSKEKISKIENETEVCFK